MRLNLVYRRYCPLELDGAVRDHSTVSKAGHGRFCDSDHVAQAVDLTVERCTAECLVGAAAFAAVANLIRADVHRQRSVSGEDGLPPEAAGRVVSKYRKVLDDATFDGLECNQMICRRAHANSGHISG